MSKITEGIKTQKKAILKLEEQKQLAKTKLKNLNWWQIIEKRKLKKRIEKCEFYALNLYLNLELLNKIK